MITSAAGLEIIKHNEGCRLTAYRDVVGVWTIGWGHTGPTIREGVTITQMEADHLLAMRLRDEFEPGVMRAIGDAPTTQNQFDAMVSLAYNIGVGAFSLSRVRRKHVERDYAGAAAGFALWNKAGGVVLKGLVRRRGEEAALYLLPDEPRRSGLVPELDRELDTFMAAESGWYSWLEIPAFAKKVQAFLNSKGAHLLDDGDFGKLSWAALGEYLRSK